jgi:uncharacterized protein
MPITTFYAALFAPLLIFLAVRIIRTRRAARIGIGHAENTELLRAIRAHGNFTEYVPLALILLALAESNGAMPLILHACGLALLAGRCIHAYGISQRQEPLKFRVTGMAMTFSVLLVLALTCLALSAPRVFGA